MQMKNDGFYRADSGQDDATRTALNATLRYCTGTVETGREIETELMNSRSRM